MSEIYWITRFDALNGLCIVFAIVSGIIAFVSGVFSLDEDTRGRNMLRAFFISLPICILMIFGAVLVPTTRDALLIYGVGGTLDYVKQNDKAKKIPDKVILALDKYLDEFDILSPLKG